METQASLLVYLSPHPQQLNKPFFFCYFSGSFPFKVLGAVLDPSDTVAINFIYQQLQVLTNIQSQSTPDYNTQINALPNEQIFNNCIQLTNNKTKTKATQYSWEDMSQFKHSLHQQSQAVCSYNLRFIIQNGAKLLEDNKLVRNHLFEYSNKVAENLDSEMLIQSGVLRPRQKKCVEEQKKPSISGKKDNFSYRSVRNVKAHQLSSEPASKISSPNRINYSALSRRSSLKNNPLGTSIENKKDKSQNFVDLKHLLSPVSARKTTQAMLQEQKEQDIMRKQYQQELNKNLQGEQQQLQQEKQNNQKKQRLKDYFNKQLARYGGKAACYTTDLEGNIIFYNPKEAQKRTSKKKYPPSAINFSFEEQEEPELENNNYLRIKQRAAKGEAFASAVLRTMNVSRISMGVNKTSNMDQYAYMKRNDLFNNNHARQVTTIPFIQITEGTHYKQTNTNLSVSKKNTQKTYHSDMKSNFKTHNQRRQIQKIKTVKDGSMISMPVNHDEFQEGQEFNKVKKRSQSSRPYRPKSSVPHTTRTASRKSAGRITSFNEQLVGSLLE